jgi:hypothetical protein
MASSRAVPMRRQTRMYRLPIRLVLRRMAAELSFRIIAGVLGAALGFALCAVVLRLTLY